jgi:anti-sigma regulatory factor (Ser/Thr protein kinase)
MGLPRDLIRDAELLVSELMTNAADASACLPERPPVTLRLDRVPLVQAVVSQSGTKAGPLNGLTDPLTSRS